MTTDPAPPGLGLFSEYLGVKITSNEQSNDSDAAMSKGEHLPVSNDVPAMTAVTDTDGTKPTSETPNGTNGVSKVDEQKDLTQPTEVATNEPAVSPGSISAATAIYKIEDKDGNVNWTSKCPEDAIEPAENEETAKFAVLVQNKKSSDPRRRFEAESLVIQSPQLKQALSNILRDYPGVSCKLTRLVFEQPYRPFMHRWPDLVAYMEQDHIDATTKEHLNVLYHVLEEELHDSIKAFEDYLSHGITTFEHAWMLFHPGSLVVSQYKGALSAYELVDTNYNQRCGTLDLTTTVVDYDGDDFGRLYECLSIPSFKGTEKITDLNAFPLAFHKDREEVKKMLIARGKRFEALAGHHFRQYNGVAITWNHDGNPVGTYHKGRIVVDCKAFGQNAPYSRRDVRSFRSKDLRLLTPKSKPSKPIDAFLARENEEDQTPDHTLDDYLLLLCHNVVRGYSLSQKRWLDFYVNNIEDIEWNSKAFDSLVLPAEQKELILSFAESQVEHRNSFDDIMEGKGKGMIILLGGKPGIGKTLTAEAVAEAMERPLHSISSGDLGTTAWNVEEKLTRILKLVARWQAVLLLDECDVFLEARSNHDLERNAMVSTFLRTLEYYEGILFMTTNRADNIDPAFESRIHVSMQYPDLTPQSRKQIWNNFLESTRQTHALTEQDLNDLAEIDLNGRQIKNVLKTSHLLASRKKQQLRREYVDIVLSIANGTKPKLLAATTTAASTSVPAPARTVADTGAIIFS